MLLHEVLSREDRWADIETTANRLGPEMKQRAAAAKTKQHKPLGSGANAFVTQDELNQQELNTVQRVARSKYDRGYTVYTTFIANHPALKQNPYFPRIRSQQETGDVTEYALERLVSFTDPRVTTVELIESLADVWFTDEGKKFLIAQFPASSKVPVERKLAWAVASTLEYAAAGDIEYIKDPQLREALQVIKSLAYDDNNDVTMDIHDENIMWRITGRTPQLVITDPLY